jgi:hypothetical protein
MDVISQADQVKRSERRAAASDITLSPILLGLDRAELFAQAPIDVIADHARMNLTMAVRANRRHPARVIRTIVRAPPHMVRLEVQLPRTGFEWRRRAAVLTDTIGTAQYIKTNCTTSGVHVLEPGLSARARRHNRKRPPP